MDREDCIGIPDSTMVEEGDNLGGVGAEGISDSVIIGEGGGDDSVQLLNIICQ